MINTPEVKEALYYFDDYKSVSYKEYIKGLNEFIKEFNLLVMTLWNDDSTISKRTVDTLFKKIDEIDSVYATLQDSLRKEVDEVLKEVALPIPIDNDVDLEFTTKPLSKTEQKNTKVHSYTLASLFGSAKIVRDLKSAIRRNNTEDSTTTDVIKDINRVKTTKISQMDTAIGETITEEMAKQKEKDYNNIEPFFDPSEYYYLFVATLDSHTTNTCRVHDGLKFNTGYSNIAQSNKPPLHWNCRSLLVMMVDEPTARASINGPVNYITYQQWIKTQSFK